MRRIGLAVILALSFLPRFDAVAQQAGKAYRVGVLASSTEANFELSVKVFREGLHAAGWVEGRNLTLDVRYPGDQYTRLQELANELVKLKVDVLATLGTPATLAAKHATTTIPIVMESLSDVVSIGLVPKSGQARWQPYGRVWLRSGVEWQAARTDPRDLTPGRSDCGPGEPSQSGCGPYSPCD
jgi:ABC-type uncharacterized transport system substrate-binding protein